MKKINIENTSITHLSIIIISVILTMAALKSAQLLFMSFTISLFLSFILRPLITLLEKIKIPTVLASLISLGSLFVLIYLIAGIIAVSFRSFSELIPFYTGKLTTYILDFTSKLDEVGIKTDVAYLLKQINPNTVASFVGKSLMSVVNVLTYSVIVFFTTLFMILETRTFQDKALVAFKGKFKVNDYFKNIGKDIQRYLVFKTLISLATGSLIYIALSIVGLDFALLWAFLAFLLNFIPSVGSIVAALPPILLALVQFDSPLKYAAIVGFIFLAVNILIGNYLDPKIMGDSFNISPLLIFMSLIFLGWLWGPIGMLLAVPLMVCLRLALYSFPKTHYIAILMQGKLSQENLDDIEDLDE